MTKYVVKDEHTLGYILPTISRGYMGVLAGSVLRGGHNPKNGPVSTFGSTIRPATENDFTAFRVMLPTDFTA